MFRDMDANQSTTTTDSVVASLRAELARKGHSQTWLADQLGESKHWVSRRFAGQTDLGLDDLLRITDALDVPVASVLPLERA